MKPEDRITAYLMTHKSRVEFSTVELVVKDVKISVFYGMSPLSDEEIRKVVVQWASIYAIGLLIRDPAGAKPPAQTPQSGPPRSDSELIATVKTVISSIADGVTVGRKEANVNIGVTGFTANLKKADSAVAVGVSWTGTLKLDANSGSFHFAGRLSKDRWEMTLSFPQDTYIPDLSTLANVFREGENAVWKLADATKEFSNINDVNKVGALIKPHAEKLEGAVEAFSGIAKAKKKGGAGFGFKLSNPEPAPGEQGMPPGVQGTIVFTYVF